MERRRKSILFLITGGGMAGRHKDWSVQGKDGGRPDESRWSGSQLWEVPEPPENLINYKDPGVSGPSCFIPTKSENPGLT